MWTIISGVAGVIFGAVGAYVALRKNRREERTQVVDEATTTIELLKEQNRLLTEQLSEAKRREAESARREDKLEKRIADVERDYRNLVLTVTTMGFCANAATCATYNPGDRRTHRE